MSASTECSGHVWMALDGYPARCSVCGSTRQATTDLDEAYDDGSAALRHATLAGIERLLRAGWVPLHHSLPLYEDQWVVEDPSGVRQVRADSLAAAVTAALAKLETK